tara:strand:- start:4874 stop:5869 length:996 start_codon:yes stop_codon:yes gene_type:complete
MKLKAAVIGSGVGLKHFEAIQNFKNSKVKSICEFDKKRANFLKKKYPKVEIVSDFNKIIKDKEINLLSIASYDQFHFNQISQAIKAGKNIIIEKPMCLKFSELKKIFRLIKKKRNVKMISNMVLRTEPIFNFLRKKLEPKKVFYIEADYIWGRLNKLTKGWRRETKNYSIILGTAIHMIDLVMWLVKDKPKKVYAIANKNLTHGTKFKKNSFASCFLEFQNNLIVKISANSTNHYKHMHEVKIFQSNKTIIQTESGVNLIKKEGESIKNKKLNLVYPLRKNRKTLIQSFINCILKKKKPMMNLKEQFNLMSVCFALEKSLKNNKRVKVKYL